MFYVMVCGLVGHILCFSLSITAKPTSSRYCPLWAFPFGLTLKVFKTCLLGRGFHTLIKNASFFSPTEVGSHNPPLFGAQRSRCHSFLSPINVGPPNPPPFEAQCPCWYTASCLHPLRAQPSCWHITRCLFLIPFVQPKPP